MKSPSFLARRTLGQPNYLLLAMAAAFVIALAPVGAWKAIKSNTNRPEQWLPASSVVIRDLDWFRSQFESQPHVVVSWEGCTLGNAAKLTRLARQLTLGGEDAKVEGNVDPGQPRRWFSEAITGPEVLAQLTAPPHSLSERDAIQQLEGVLIGPTQRDERGHSLGDDSRTTCLLVRLTPQAAATEEATRDALSLLTNIADAKCGIPAASIRLAGPLAEDAAIDHESQLSFLRLASLACVVAFIVGAARLGSVRLAAIVVGVGAIGGAMSLAIVFYFGIAERMITGLPRPGLGVTDALLMSLPAAAFLAAAAAAIRIVHYYRQQRASGNPEDAVEQAVRRGWQPCIAAAAITGIAVAALYLSDLEPLRRFGVFAGLGLLAAVGLALTVVPVALFRFPLERRSAANGGAGLNGRSAPMWLLRMFDAAVAHRAAAAVLGLCALAALGAGMLRLEPSVRMPALLDERAALLKNYAWFEERLGNVVPLEVVFTIPQEHTRGLEESPETDGQQYRLAASEQIRLAREVADRIAAVPGVSGALSPATFLAENATEPAPAEKAKLLDDFVHTEQLGREHPTGRKLWRISARIGSAANQSQDEYDALMENLRLAVNPVLTAYEQRDWLVRNLHERGKQLAGAKACLLFSGPEIAEAPPDNSSAMLLANLLRDSGVAPEGVTFFNLASLDAPRSNEASAAFREQSFAKLRESDAVVLSAPGANLEATQAAVDMLSAQELNVIDVSAAPSIEESAANRFIDAGGPRPIRWALTGMPPVVHAAEIQLLPDLRKAAVPALAVIAIGMMMATRRALAGLASVIPFLLPLAALLGALGWLGVPIDLGVVLLACVALAIGAEGVNHYLAAHRDAGVAGLAPVDAAAWAFDHSAPASVDVALILGLSLSVFALSGIAAVQQFGLLAIPTMVVALFSHLIVLPALAVNRSLARSFGAEWPAAKPTAAPVVTSKAVSAAPTQPVVAPATGAFSDVPRPSTPHNAPAAAAGIAERLDPAEGPHSALHAKLRQLRQSSTRDSKPS